MNLVSMDSALRSGFLPEAWILLILLAGAILLYWSFRERYLVPWIAGWSAFGAAKFLTLVSMSHPHDAVWAVLAYTAFVVSFGLFANAVFLYTHQNKLFWIDVGLLLLAAGSGVARAIWFGPTRLLICEILWRLVLAFASLHLVRFAWGRLNIGRWLLAATLFLLHIDQASTAHTFVGFDILVDLL